MIKPDRNDIRLVRRTVLELSIQFSLLQVKEVSEICRINIETVSRVIKYIIRNQEIYGKYNSKQKLIYFNYKANNLNVEKLIDIYKSHN